MEKISSIEEIGGKEGETEKTPALELKYRNPLQVRLMLEILGKHKEEEMSRLWTDNYATLVGDILNEDEEIKQLARSGQIEEAIGSLKNKISFDEEIHLAA